MTHTKLDPAQSKQLRNQHPLYQKLSGDVIWVLYEERGFDAEACGKAMDEFIATMHSTVAVMQALDNGTAQHFAVQGEPRGEQCGAAIGQSISTDSPQWRECLPPYAVGCSLSCRVIETDKPQGTQDDHSMRPPRCGLFCPYL